jgi:hypothetical protein
MVLSTRYRLRAFGEGRRENVCGRWGGPRAFWGDFGTLRSPAPGVGEGVDEVSEALDEVGEALDEVSEGVDWVGDAVDEVGEGVDGLGDAVDWVGEAVDGMPGRGRRLRRSCRGGR